MSERWSARLQWELDRLRSDHRYRSLRTYTGIENAGIDFGSNDYLGFAHDAELKEKALRALLKLPLSSSASRLLPGNHIAHLEAESAFAIFIGSESALLFNSGYDANYALLSTLPTRHDLILYDERSHASIYDGAHASLAMHRRFQHNSVAHLREMLAKAERETGQIFIVIESVYSMDGDLAHILEIAKAAKDFAAILIVDEAHATGVLGTRGEGLTRETVKQSDNLITVHTCGKALGAAGAFVCGSNIVTEYLVNKARPFIFSTALPPIVPLQIMHGITKLKLQGTTLTRQLKERSVFVRSELQRSMQKWRISDGVTPIISIVIGSDTLALQASKRLAENGFIVPAIRPPTVPEGTARLRMNISLRHSEEELKRAIAAVIRVERELLNL